MARKLHAKGGRGRPSIFTDDEIANIVLRYVGGESIKSIAEDYDCSTGTLPRHVRHTDRYQEAQARRARVLARNPSNAARQKALLLVKRRTLRNKFAVLYAETGGDLLDDLIADLNTCPSPPNN